MKKWFLKAPIKSSVMSTIVIMAAYLLARRLLRNAITGNELPWFYLDGALRLAFSLPAILLLGIIVQKNGFRYALAPKGTKAAIFASAPILLWLLTPLLHLLNAASINAEALPMVPAILFFDAANAIFEEVLWRGLFMTAMLLRWGGTARGRLVSILVSGAVFGGLHISDGMVAVVLTAIIGFSLASIYVYSGNLLLPMLLHALWNYGTKLPNLLITEVHNPTLLKAVQIAQPAILLILMPLCAILITIKATPQE